MISKFPKCCVLAFREAEPLHAVACSGKGSYNFGPSSWPQNYLERYLCCFSEDGLSSGKIRAVKTTLELYLVWASPRQSKRAEHYGCKCWLSKWRNSLKEIASCIHFVKHMWSRISRKTHIAFVKTIIQFGIQNQFRRKDKKNIESAKMTFLTPFFVYTLNWIECKVEKYVKNIKLLTQ